MATYECEKCGMSVNATCGKCDESLINDTLNLDNGSSVQISKCPNGHGKLSHHYVVAKIWAVQFKLINIWKLVLTVFINKRNISNI